MGQKPHVVVKVLSDYLITRLHMKQFMSINEETPQDKIYFFPILLFWYKQDQKVVLYLPGRMTPSYWKEITRQILDCNQQYFSTDNKTLHKRCLREQVWSNMHSKSNNYRRGLEPRVRNVFEFWPISQNSEVTWQLWADAWFLTVGLVYSHEASPLSRYKHSQKLYYQLINTALTHSRWWPTLTFCWNQRMASSLRMRCLKPMRPVFRFLSAMLKPGLPRTWTQRRGDGADQKSFSWA